MVTKHESILRVADEVNLVYVKVMRNTRCLKRSWAVSEFNNLKCIIVKLKYT